MMKRMTVLEYLTEKGVICLGERICPYCGAHLDPQELCDCRMVDEDEKENSTRTDQSIGAINK